MKEKIKLLFLIWTVGLFGGLFFWLLRILNRIEVKGYDRKKFNSGEKGLILLSNHPSLWETFFLPFLFFPWFCFSSRLVPFLTPDRSNYYDNWWYWPIRAVSIPIIRGNPREEARALRAMINYLKQRRILILFPEGGRTCKGENFNVSKNGKKVRHFRPGIRRLVIEARPLILPVWVEGGDRIMPNGISAKFAIPFPKLWEKATIKIGSPLNTQNIFSDEILGFLEDSLLKLAEE